MGAKVENLDYVIQAMGKEREKTERTIAEGLWKAGEIILKKSQELVPVDTGELRSTGKLFSWGSGLNTVVFIRYSAEHAIWVHENLEAYHKPPTQARYLADAVSKSRGTVTAMLKRQLLAGRNKA